MSSNLDIVKKYASDVLSGTLPSCRMVKLAVERWERDWQRTDIYFDKDQFDRFVNFSTFFRHYKGPAAGTFFELEPWQMFIAANIFGWIRRDIGYRRFNYADIEVPRKNGKTFFATTVGLYCLMGAGEPAAEVYSAAVDKEQAKICFDAAKELLDRSDFRPYAKIYRGEIKYPDNASAFKPLSKDTKNKDGLNPYCAICDERHAWKTNEILEVLKTGMGARTQPLIFSISTAGTDTSYPYFQDLDFLRSVLEGKADKDNHFIMIWEPDEGDDWESEVTWKKVNPNFGVSLSPEFMRSEYREAKQRGGTTMAAFQTKNLDMWVDAPETWIEDAEIVANLHDAGELQGDDCWVGIDFASKTDIAAVAFWFPDANAVRWFYVVPEAKVTDSTRGDRVDYRVWVEQGFLTVCPGKVIDEDWFMAALLDRFQGYKIRGIMYDPWGMWNMLDKFGRYKEKLVEWPQAIRNMSVPTKWLESAILQHKLDFGADPIARWMFGNVVIYRDPNDNIKLDKARSRNKIDGVVALVDALGGWLNETAGKGSGEIYSDHGLRIIPTL